MNELNWFSPLPPLKTGIADFSVQILPELAQTFEKIHLLAPQDNWSREQFHADKVLFSSLNSHTYREDLTGPNIYNIGNNEPFHASIYEASLKRPGIVVLHDLCLQHFFTNYFKVRNNLKGYLSLMEKHYGKSGRNAAKKLFRGKVSILDICEEFPLLEEVTSHCNVIITHSLEAMKILKTRCPNNKVLYIPLAYGSNYQVRVPRSYNKESEKFNIILFGYLGENRRVISFLKAFSKIKDKHRFTINILGEFYSLPLLKTTIQELHLADSVQFHGYVSEEMLNKNLEKADLAINLRYPTMHEASASHLLISKHGIPTFTTDIGWYSTLPRNSTYSVSVNHEEDDIIQGLKNFLSDPEVFFKQGEISQQIYFSNHLPKNYINNLKNIVASL